MAEKIKVPAGVYDMVTRCMEQEFPDNVAIRYVAEDGKTVVEKHYREYARDIRKMVTYLKNEVPDLKDRSVVLLSRNCYEFCVASYGIILAGGVLYAIATGKSDFSLAGGFACNGYGEHSPGQYSAAACFLCEVVMTAMFIVVILGSTDKRAPAGFGPLAIGLCLTLIHLISIPVTNTSVNPARSLGVALFEGGWALEQLWMFIVAPVLGAIVGAIVYRIVGGDD